MSDQTKSAEELRRAFIDEALESQARVHAGEPVYAADEVFAYLRAKASGQKVSKPRPVERFG